MFGAGVGDGGSVCALTAAQVDTIRAVLGAGPLHARGHNGTMACIYNMSMHQVLSGEWNGGGR